MKLYNKILRFSKLLLFIFLIFSAMNVISQQVLEMDEINFKHKDRQTFDDSQLKDAIAISKSKKYNKKLIEGDIQKLKKYYFKEYFWYV